MSEIAQQKRGSYRKLTIAMMVFMPGIQCLWCDAWAQISSNTRAFLAIRGEI
jgi:hypothetical protein